MANDNPSLLMWRPNAAVEEYTLPNGYQIRAMRRGEESAWCACMLHDMGVEELSCEQFIKKMGNESVREGYIYMVANERDEPVATATAQIKGENDPWLHMVSVKPTERGKKLAKPLVAAVLRRHMEEGRDGCYLFTQEYRTAAVKLYLDLGFLPVMNHPSYRVKFEQLAFDYGLPAIKCLDENRRPCEDILPKDHALVFGNN
ncbi:MAG: GNAT family N-acetyltransferase [Oscillospiraceae bacterium]|jgi:GNAT superfamily N-acetyltransferase|nr:GNAT family N-acetyltransferase [Oscillospiraceae bacterium]